MQTVAYLRVSTEGQTTENQRREIEAAGFAPTLVYAEVVSGKAAAAQRMEFGRMLDTLGRMEGPKRLVVTKLDRLGRDAGDVLATMRRLRDLGVEVVVLQLGKLDLASAAGKLMLTMLSAVSEMERDLLIERTQSGLARARAEGKRLGRPAKLDPDKIEKAKRLMAAEGATVAGVARALGVSRQTVSRAVAAV
jgi:DNA invertase Pin-like site-specific DNA recombinase